jgi:hypothetical protein
VEFQSHRVTAMIGQNYLIRNAAAAVKTILADDGTWQMRSRMSRNTDEPSHGISLICSWI